MGDLAHPVEIRAHHLLCLLGFRGLGYSPEFVEKMGEVAGELRSNAATPITILAECDVICGACPHNKGNKCRKKRNSAARVREKDLAVLRHLGLEVGAQMSVAQAWAIVKEKVTAKDLAKELCRRCQWRGLGYCAEGLDKLVTG